MGGLVNTSGTNLGAIMSMNGIVVTTGVGEEGEGLSVLVTQWEGGEGGLKP